MKFSNFNVWYILIAYFLFYINGILFLSFEKRMEINLTESSPKSIIILFLFYEEFATMIMSFKVMTLVQ